MKKEKVKVTIYCIVDPFTLKVRYIGRTKNTMETRLQYHLGKAKSYRKYGKKLTHVHNWFNKCMDKGRRPIMRKLCEVIGWSESHVVEKSLIAKYKDRLVNLDDRGEGGFNRKISKSQRVQIAKTLKEGYASGRIESLSKKEVHVYDLKGDFIKTYGSRTDAASDLNIHLSSILRVLDGIHRKCKGYQFSDVFVEKMPDVSKYGKGQMTEVNILNTQTNVVEKYPSVSSCAKDLNLSDKFISLRRLPYELKKVHNDTYILISNAKKISIKVIEPVQIKNLETDEILTFENYRSLGKFLNLSRGKCYKAYIEQRLEKSMNYKLY